MSAHWLKLALDVILFGATGYRRMLREEAKRAAEEKAARVRELAERLEKAHHGDGSTTADR